MASAGLLPDICEDHPASGVFTAEDGNILFFLHKIVSNDLEIKMGSLYAGYSRNALFCSKYFLQFIKALYL